VPPRHEDLAEGSDGAYEHGSEALVAVIKLKLGGGCCALALAVEAGVLLKAAKGINEALYIVGLDLDCGAAKDLPSGDYATDNHWPAGQHGLGRGHSQPLNKLRGGGYHHCMCPAEGLKRLFLIGEGAGQVDNLAQIPLLNVALNGLRCRAGANDLPDEMPWQLCLQALGGGKNEKHALELLYPAHEEHSEGADGVVRHRLHTAQEVFAVLGAALVSGSLEFAGQHAHLALALWRYTDRGCRDVAEEPAVETAEETVYTALGRKSHGPQGVMEHRDDRDAEESEERKHNPVRGARVCDNDRCPVTQGLPHNRKPIEQNAQVMTPSASVVEGALRAIFYPMGAYFEGVPTRVPGHEVGHETGSIAALKKLLGEGHGHLERRLATLELVAELADHVAGAKGVENPARSNCLAGRVGVLDCLYACQEDHDLSSQNAVLKGHSYSIPVLSQADF